MHHYFAYGSNLEPVQMSRRCPSSRAVGRARLSDHRLCFPLRSGDWAGGVAGIEPAAGQTVRGVVYTLDDADLAALDGYEGVAEGMYRRARVEVGGGDGRWGHVWTYIAAAEPGGPFPPSRRYLDAIVRGALHHGLPSDYIAQLQAIVTLDGEKQRDKSRR